jgi:hypothetical protein
MRACPIIRLARTVLMIGALRHADHANIDHYDRRILALYG